MELGFACFEGFEDALHQDEGFPSAPYQMWNAKQLFRINIRLSHFASDPKDRLDACVVTAPVREYIQGCGVGFGGGDCLGVIVVADRLDRPIVTVLQWPRGR